MLRKLTKEVCELGNQLGKKILIAKLEVGYMEKTQMKKFANRAPIIWYTPSKREFRIFNESLHEINNESQNLVFFIDRTNQLIGIALKEC